jgi:hypothetical protein
LFVKVTLSSNADNLGTGVAAQGEDDPFWCG